MLEVIILFVLAGKIGKVVEEKGRKKIGYQVMLVGLWICGELLGTTLGLLTALVAEIDKAKAGLFLVPFASVGAIIGSVIAFRIAKRVSPLDANEGFYRLIEFADRAGVRERFRDRQVAPPIHDAFTGYADNARRPLDDRSQE